MKSHEFLPDNRPLSKCEAEDVKEAAIAFAKVIEENILEYRLPIVYASLKETVRLAYDSIALVEERGRGI